MTERIRVNGVFLDMPKNKVTRNIRVSDVGDIGSFKTSFSYTLKLPKTSKNISVFEMLGVLGNQSRKPYEMVTVDFFVEDVLLVEEGRLIIKEKEGNYFNCFIIDGGFGLNEVLGDSLLNDLDLSSLSHNITIQNVIDSFENTEGFIYALADFGKNTPLNPKAVFDIDNIDLIGTKSLPISVDNQDEGMGGKDVTSTSGTTTTANSFYITLAEEEEIEITSEGIEIDIEVNFNSTSDSTVELQLNQFRGSLYSSVAIASVTGNSSSGVLELSGLINSSYTDIEEGDFFILSVHDSAGTAEWNVLNYSLVVNTIKYIKVDELAPSIFAHTLFNEILTQNNITYDSNIFTNTYFLKELVTVSKGYSVTGFNQLIEFDGLLDDIKQYDFIKDIANRYGLIVVGNWDKDISLVTIESIFNGDYDVEDWTGKVAAISGENYQATYSKKNKVLFDYPNDSDKLNDLDGVLLIDNENLEPEQELFSSIFEIANDSEIYKGVQLYKVPIWSLDEDIVAENETTPIKLFSNILENVTIGFKILDKTDLEIYTGDVSFLSLEDISLSDSITLNYNLFKSSFDDYEMLKVKLNLNVIDVFNLDFKKLKYIKHKGQKYYLNNIKYTSGEISEAEMLKIL